MGRRVDLGGLEVGAPGVEGAAAGYAGGWFDAVARVLVDQHIELGPAGRRVLLVVLLGDELGLPERYLLLHFHDLIMALLLDVLGHRQLRVLFHPPRDRAGLFGVLEAADGVELDLFDEIEEFLVVLIGLAGEAGDEGGADGHAGDALTQLVA